MSNILLVFVFLMSSTAFARESVALPAVNFQVTSDQVMSKLDQVISNPERVLRRYRPVGVRVNNKRVAGNEISFTAVKTVLLISKSVYVHGILETSEIGRGCARQERAYFLRMRFDSSDRLVTDNVDEMRALVCVRENSDSKMTGQIRPQLIKGDRYSRALGPLAVDLIKDQVGPLLNALTEEIKSLR